MKVLCIDGKPRPDDIPNTPLPEENQVYTVLLIVDGTHPEKPEIRKPCYLLEEIDFIINTKRGPALAVYEVDRFIPLSEKDEREYAESVLEEIFQTV